MDSNFWKNKKVLLTGHTGFKGSWLSLWLQKLQVDLIGFSKSIPTQPSLFELADVGKNMTSIMKDIRNIQDISDTVKEHKPDIVIHMAAQSLVQKSYEDPLKTGVVTFSETQRQGTNISYFFQVQDERFEVISGPIAY